uniref:Uncharacterized protein n=1 Tax=Anguilla anguilla TaxID=7936 RepID=A0A0E9QRS8_ANGAN
MQEWYSLRSSVSLQFLSYYQTLLKQMDNFTI